MASAVNHTVRLPRARSPASYSVQFFTRCCWAGMWCRRSALVLNGMVALLRSRAHPQATLPRTARSGDPCNKVLRGRRHRDGQWPGLAHGGEQGGRDQLILDGAPLPAALDPDVAG